MNETIRRFKEELEQEACDYRLLEPIADGRAHIRFTGRFQGEELIWDAVIVTLAREYRDRYPGGTVSREVPALPQFIEVGEAVNGLRRLRVGLNVARIDETTLRKTIIMIRKYRRLRPGRHEYEPAWKPG